MAKDSSNSRKVNGHDFNPMYRTYDSNGNILTETPYIVLEERTREERMTDRRNGK